MMMTHGQAPDQSKVSPEMKDAVLHARISVGGTELMGADIPNAQPMRSAYLSLGVDSDAEAERIFSALSEGGEVFMPMQETFFATRFGQLRDRFGINWMIIHERPMDAPARLTCRNNGSPCPYRFGCPISGTTRPRNPSSGCCPRPSACRPSG